MAVLVASLFLAAAVAVISDDNENGVDQAFTDLAFANDGVLLNKANFGGTAAEEFFDVIIVPDGFVAVGYSDYNSFGNGDWTPDLGADVVGYGDRDAIIVKFTANWTVAWKQYFGGAGDDGFYGVAMMNLPDTQDNYLLLAVGYSGYDSFGNGSWYSLNPDVVGYGSSDAIIVAFNDDGTLSDALYFGGAGADCFNAIAVSPLNGDVYAVGYSEASSFTGSGYWVEQGFSAKGNDDAILVVYRDGMLNTAMTFGGAGEDGFNDVTVSSNGDVFAVGYSYYDSFGTGDWEDVDGKGNYDAIIVAYMWDSGKNTVSFGGAMNFGGAGHDMFNGVGVTSQGAVFAVGYSYYDSFGTGDWVGVTGWGKSDAIIVGFEDYAIFGALNFGGADDDYFNAVAVSPSGDVYAVGHSYYDSFGTGDWADVEGKGSYDAIIAVYSEAEFVGAMNYGGVDDDGFRAVTLLPDGYVIAVGYSYHDSFGTGDWDGVDGNGDYDAIAMRLDVTIDTGGDISDDGGSLPWTFIAIGAVAAISVISLAYFLVFKP